MGLLFPLCIRNVRLWVLMVAKRSFLDIFLEPLMFVPIIPDDGSVGLYANSISSLWIPISWSGPCSGGDITRG